MSSNTFFANGYNYDQILSSLQARAKAMISKDKPTDLSLFLVDIPTNKKDLDLWAHKCVGLLSEFLRSTEDIDDLLYIIVGIIACSRTKHTPELSHLSSIRLYCKTNGILHELLSMLSCGVTSDPQVDLTSSLFSSITGKSLISSLSSIYLDGYLTWPELLPVTLIKHLRDLSLLSRSWYLVHESEQRSHFQGRISEYHGSFIKATTKLCLTNEFLLNIAYDNKLKAVIDSYLGGRSILRVAELWISRSSECFSPSSEAAQIFHYDLDTFKWLKVFIYLSDVDKVSGAHCALPGTHIPCSKHPCITSKLYSRIRDDELFAYQKEIPQVFSGIAGTIIIGDTKAFHKGLPVMNGERVMLQLIYSCTDFSLSFGNNSVP